MREGSWGRWSGKGCVESRGVGNWENWKEVR